MNGVLVYRGTQYKNLTTMLSRAIGVSETPAIRKILDKVDWSSGLSSSLQQLTLKSTQLQLCTEYFTNVSWMQLSSSYNDDAFIGNTTSACPPPYSKRQVCLGERMWWCNLQTRLLLLIQWQFNDHIKFGTVESAYVHIIDFCSLAMNTYHLIIQHI